LTGKRLQRGRLLLPFVKGGAAVQSLNTHASEAVGLWRRTVGRDLRKLFSEQLEHSHPIPSLHLTLPRKNSILTGRPGSKAPRSKALLFEKELRGQYNLKKSHNWAVSQSHITDNMMKSFEFYL